MPGRPKVERPAKITVNLTADHASRLDVLAVAMGQPVSVAASVAITLGLRTLETLYQLADLGSAVDALVEPMAVETVREMADAGLPVVGVSK